MSLLSDSNRDAVSYEEEYHKERHVSHFDEQYYEARARVALKKFFTGFDLNSRVLDFGCGMGQNIYKLKNAMGYDISSYSVNFCKQKGIQATNNLEDLAKESFDIVLSSHSLEHHPYPKKMLEQIHFVLKKDATLILVLPHERHGRARGKANYQLDLNQHLYTWNFQTIDNLLITTGFKVVENRYVRGAGYQKLLGLSKLGDSFYQFATNTLSRMVGIKELLIIAKKVG